MNDDRVERIRGHLATVMATIRPDWDVAGCVAALRALPDDLALHAIGIAALRYAGDETNLTPGNLANFSNRAWESDWYLPCKIHPQCRARRTDGECANCYADRKAASEPLPLRRLGAPLPDEARALVHAVFRHEPTGDA